VGLLAASALGPDWHAMGTAVLGGAVVFAVFYALWFFVPRAMGFGDVRLAGVVSVGLAWLGFGTLYIGLLFGFVAGAVFGIATALVRRSGRRTTFPFGPALALGRWWGCCSGRPSSRPGSAPVEEAHRSHKVGWRGAPVPHRW